MKCIVAQKLDSEDLEALPALAGTFKRVYLYGEIRRLYGPLFGLTALKDHLNKRCVCTKARTDG
ncbi:hypothetical protein L3Y21_gp122 [Gordonia phage Rabbitrun]|uniref:Uncharacterized protein n=1 Tax=Gordonia phage Rabbitrun TaxID=2762280 RepID=A0A7G8LIS5_9CAUD|nr:hypothetical protein L3Y21_gp122 [Gordonia phage Rabbitrun]QNJ57147.1 hypothetical protein SEA_RABBITRUN_114 [Gordonia phage Rabbitrun]